MIHRSTTPINFDLDQQAGNGEGAHRHQHVDSRPILERRPAALGSPRARSSDFGAKIVKCAEIGEARAADFSAARSWHADLGWWGVLARDPLGASERSCTTRTRNGPVGWPDT